MSEMGHYPVIMGGDFNRVWDLVLDRQPSTPRPRRSINILKDMCRVWVLEIYDTFIIQCPENILFTPNPMDHSLMVNILPHIKSTRSLRWRMNSSLLLDTGFAESLRAQITLFKETNLPTAPSMGAVWEVLKVFYGGFCHPTCYI